MSLIAAMRCVALGYATARSEVADFFVMWHCDCMRVMSFAAKAATRNAMPSDAMPVEGRSEVELDNASHWEP